MTVPEDIDLKICAELFNEFRVARDRYSSFAQKLAVQRCAYLVGDIVVDKTNHCYYQIKEIKGYAVANVGDMSDNFFGVEIRGERVNKKTLKLTGSTYAGRVKLYERDIVLYHRSGFIHHGVEVK